jgi:NAD(P)-dependent dehydrogenase (short-subunit alcohol dehydrogenase family)
VLDKVAIVTGGGSGLGRALAESLAAVGWCLVLAGRRADRLADTAATMPADRVRTIAVDLTDENAAERVVGLAVDAFGGIDALVNNAGAPSAAPSADTPMSEVDLMLRTNLLAPMALIRAAVPHLAERRGSVVNVGSIGGILALPGRSAYGASKAALLHLTRSLAREFAPDVRVNAIAPGAIDTGVFEDADRSAEETRALREYLIGLIPLGRMGTTADVVPWIEMLLGPAGAYVTGSVFVIDGGRSC